MDVAGEDQALQAVLGRSDFGGIDNEALDFSQLEDYINDDNDSNIYFHEALVGSDIKLLGNGETPTNQHKAGLVTTQATLTPSVKSASNVTSSVGHADTVGSPTVSTTATEIGFQTQSFSAANVLYQPTHHLPDSPPDSGSEPPFSPHNEEAKVSAPSSRSSSDVVMLSQQQHDQGLNLKHFIAFGTTHPLKHLPDGGLGHPHSPPTSSSGHLHPQTSTTNSHILTALSQPALSSTGGLHAPALMLQRPAPLVSPTAGAAHIPPPAVVSPGHLGSIYGSDVSLCSNEDFLCDSLSSPSSSVGNPTKKRKLSDSPKVTSSHLNGMHVHVKQEPAGGGLSPEPSSSVLLVQSEEDYTFDFNNPEASMFMDSVYQCIKFQPFQPNTWSTLLDQNLKELPLPNYRVDADKGFNFSNADEAFVCQKKNHFQVTVHVQVLSDPVYVKSPEGIKKVDNFYLHFHGVKMESPSQTIKVEQSQSDRSKKPFHPVLVDLANDQISKTTVGRMHFSETTSNNMRKKGKPNPDQRYFFLVVGLYAHVGEITYPIIAQSSERIIVRASNPGQFENDMELSWQKGHTQDSIYHAGRVGINTDRPDESLVIHGNVRVTGHIVQPSDERAKTNVKEMDSKEQLKNVANMKIVEYDYRPEFASQVGLHAEELHSTGVLAQDVRKILPDAVREAGDVVLADGETIQNFLVVNKERIFMENVGAVKELCKVTDNLETRIDELERINRKLTKLKRLDSIKSTCSGSTVASRGSSLRQQVPSLTASGRSHRTTQHHKHRCREEEALFCTNRLVQGTIVILVLVMAFCLAAVATLYILEWQKRHTPPNDAFILNAKTSHISTPTTHDSSSSVHQHSTESVQDLNRPDNKWTNEDSGKAPTAWAGGKGWTPSRTGSLDVTLSSDMPTAVPILKPLVLGTPAECAGLLTPPDICSVSCCSGGVVVHRGDVSPDQQRHRDVMEAVHDVDDDVIKNASSREGLSGRTGLEGRSLNLSAMAAQVLNSDHHQQQRDPLRKADVPGDTRPALDPDNLHPDRGVIEDVQDNNALLTISKVSRFDHSNHSQEASNETEAHWKQTTESRRRRDALQPPLLLLLRRRRSRDAVNDSRGQISKIQARKELYRSVRSLKLVELNATVGMEYCNNLPCVNQVGPMFSYHLPISKYMPLEYVTLLFNFDAPLIIDHCEPKDKTLACQSGLNVLRVYHTQSTQNLVEEMNSHWRLPIGLYLRSSYRFRIMTRSVVDTPCSLPDNELGRSFVEYNLVFQRKCDK